MRKELAVIAGLSAALLLGACTSSSSKSDAGSGTPAQQQALARYTTYAGPSLSQFTWLGQFYSWEALSKDQLAVWTTPNEAYLLKVWPSCDLRFSGLGIGISSTAKTIYSGLDSVVVRSGGRPLTCPIDSIRKIDVQRMRAELHQPPPNPTPPENPTPAIPTPGNTPSPNPQR
jgi:hypothetical protein